MTTDSQPSAYSESARDVRPSTLAEELGLLAIELSHESLELLVEVGRRLARAEEQFR